MEQLKKYIKENLQKGFIRKSNSNPFCQEIRRNI